MTAITPSNYLGKRPRHYAFEIVALPTKAARYAALERVPDIYRDWVKELVEDIFMKQRFRKVRHATTTGQHPVR